MSNPLESFGFSVAGKVLDHAFNERSASNAYRRQQNLMKMQNQFAIENWERENSYNTPERQKERLLAAGLNPDMMYGQSGIAAMADGIAAPTAPSAPMAAPTSSMIDSATTMYNSALNASLIAAQVKKLGSETLGIEIENKVKEDLLRAQEKELLAKAGLSEREQELIQPKIDEINKRIDLYTSEIDVNDEKIKTFDFERYMDVLRYTNETRQLEGQLKRWVSENLLNQAQANQLNKMTPELVQQIIQGNKNAALDYLINSLKVDPEKAVEVASSWIDTIIDPFVRLFRKKGKSGPTEKYVYDNGDMHTLGRKW